MHQILLKINNQIYVTPQKGRDCGAHAVRNALYMLAMLKSSASNWNSLYDDMKNKQLFQLFADQSLTYGFCGYNIVSPKDFNWYPECAVAKPPCIPAYSKDLSRYLINDFPGFIDVTLEHIGFDFFLNTIKDLLKSVESSISSSDIDMVKNSVWNFPENNFSNQISEVRHFLDVCKNYYDTGVVAILVNLPDHYIACMLAPSDVGEIQCIADSLSNIHRINEKHIDEIVEKFHRYAAQDCVYLKLTLIRLWYVIAYGLCETAFKNSFQTKSSSAQVALQTLAIPRFLELTQLVADCGAIKNSLFKKYYQELLNKTLTMKKANTELSDAARKEIKKIVEGFGVYV